MSVIKITLFCWVLEQRLCTCTYFISASSDKELRDKQVQCSYYKKTKQ